ncbi:MAG: ribonucleoside-diphosphate reductase subunit alpha, partial [Verrucomicrobiaceae bacterium]
MNTAEFPSLATPPAVATEYPQVIRRDSTEDASGKPRVVPWLGHKIQRAVAAACAAVGADEAIGHQVQGEIEFRMKREHPSFIHVEQLQDLVEETLIDLGHAKVALAYAKYRGRRAGLRELREESAPADEGQLELASREQLADIRARIS